MKIKVICKSLASKIEEFLKEIENRKISVLNEK